MPAPKANLVYRFSGDTGDLTDKMSKTGKAGEEMSKRIREGAKSVPPALKALDAAAGEAKKSVEGLAGQAGGIGKIFSSIGPAGVAAAAGVGVLIGAFAGARDAANSMRDLQRAAASVGGDTDTLQEWRAILQQAGGDITGADRALQGLSEKLGELSSGVGLDAAKNLKAIGFTDAEIARMTSVRDALPEIARRLAELDNVAERTALAKKLGIGDLVPALNAGSDALDGMRARAHELGLVFDRDVIARGAEAATQLDLASAVIDNKLKSALVDLLPLMQQTAGALAGMATAAADVYAQFQKVEERSAGAIRRRVASIEKELADRAKKVRLPFIEGANQDYERDLRVERANLIAELGFREFDKPKPTVTPGGKPPGGAPSAKADPNAALKTELEKLRELTEAREKLEAMERAYPGILQAEAKERVALADTMDRISEARAKGVIATDAEAEALRKMAQANFDAAQAVRDRDAAQKRADEETRRQEEADRAAAEAATALAEAERARQEQFQLRFEQTRDLLQSLAAGGEEAERAILALANEVIPKLIAKLFDLKAAQAGSLGGDGGLADMIVSIGASLFGGGKIGFTPVTGPIETVPQFGGGARGNPIGVLSFAGGRASGGWVEEGNWVDVHANERVGVVGGRAYVQAAAISAAAPPVNIRIINQAGGEIEARQERGVDGEGVVINIMRKAIRNGELDPHLRARFGIRPAVG